LAQREPFYNKYAEITIDVSNYDIDHTVDKIIELAKV
jgi:shikimate kinase